MAEVVRESLQYLSDRDILAMGGYLKALPQTDPASKQESIELLSLQEASSSLKLGAALYEKHCADCHQATGEGVPPAYPPLAGNRSINTPSAINSIRMVVNGGFPPSTTGNPRPFGMPPFGPAMDDVEVAAVVSYIRNSWGNRAEFVSPVEVSHYRAVPLD
jgi:mono/diheme cytochrome c family protein